MSSPSIADTRFARRYGPWALITGASDGIGKACADAVAARGINVVLAARGSDRLHAVADELHAAHGVETAVVATDFGVPSAPAMLAAQVSHLDIGLVVLAAGFGTSGAFCDLPVDREREMIDVNVGAVTVLAHLFTGALIQRGAGGIMLFGSIVGRQGVPQISTYAATKAYIQTFAEGLHAELRPLGVDVLCVLPGPVSSGFGGRAGLTMSGAAAPRGVARAAMEALGRGCVVPGIRAKMLSAALATVPRRMRTRAMARVIAGMRSRQPARIR